MSTRRRAIWFLPVTLLFAGTCLAQAMPRGNAMHQHYDPAQETTIQAAVESTFTGTGRMHGVVWKVKAEDRDLTVILGPASFLAEKQFSATAGDPVVVTGAPLPNRPDVIVAREVEVRGTVLTLRDKQGRPEWAAGPGWRR